MTSTSFLICEKCEKVTELEKDNLKSFLELLVKVLILNIQITI